MSTAAILGLLLVIGVAFDIIVGRSLEAGIGGRRHRRRILWTALIAGYLVVLAVMRD
jgi:hypothetical protein